MTGDEAGEEARVETRDDSGDGLRRTAGSVAGWQAAASLRCYAILAVTGPVRDAFSVSESLVGLSLVVGLLGYTVFLSLSDAAVGGYGEKPVMVVGLLAPLIALAGVTLAPPSYLLLLATVALLRAAYSTAMSVSNRGIVATAPTGSKNLAMGPKQVGVTVGNGVLSLVVTDVAVVAVWQAGFQAIVIFTASYALAFITRYHGSLGTGRLERPRLTGLGDSHAYVALIAAGLLIGTSILSTLGYAVLYVQDVVGTDPALAGGAPMATWVTGSVGCIGAGSLADRLGGPRDAAIVVLVQLAGTIAFPSLLVGTGGSFALTTVIPVTLGLTTHGSTGVFYSCLSDVIDDGDIEAATAGGQTALNAGGLVAPPSFGFVVESTGYRAGWILAAGPTVLATVLLFVVKRRIWRRETSLYPRDHGKGDMCSPSNWSGNKGVA